ncbi:MAG: hypothetical protein M9962_11840 [Oligoflexia bacterium]|nr:hypothetical protein [Oligoflexia bacterium]
MKTHFTTISILLVLSAVLAGSRAHYNNRKNKSIYDFCDPKISQFFLIAYVLKKNKPKQSESLLNEAKKLNSKNPKCQKIINQQLSTFFNK